MSSFSFKNIFQTSERQRAAPSFTEAAKFAGRDLTVVGTAGLAAHNLQLTFPESMCGLVSALMQRPAGLARHILPCGFK